MLHRRGAGPRHVPLPRRLSLRRLPGQSRSHHRGGVQPPQRPSHLLQPLDLPHLLLCQPPRVRLDGHHCSLIRRRRPPPLSQEVLLELRQPDRLCQPLVPQLPRFLIRLEIPAQLLHHPPRHHLLHPPIELLRQRRSLHVHPKEAAPIPQPHFPPPHLPASGEWAPPGVVGAGHGGVYEGVGPTGHHRQSASAGYPGDCAGHHFPERRRRELSRDRVEIPQQMVRHAAAIRDGHLVGGDVESPVHLNLIRVHHLPGELGCQIDRQLRLPRPRGAHDHHHALLPSVIIVLNTIIFGRVTPPAHVLLPMAASLRHRCDRRGSEARRSQAMEALE
ncbi:hypothetical protein MUK42_13000 [Musa troglodytarum]|uniref:Uncharacterized protein n=1 Tax=Musa troglodytarum TaxID=320322 RepID=A0A9E7H877_9LILI|nr:hypothetical protein MUK42_13000 [Musa troglodytarum]